MERHWKTHRSLNVIVDMPNRIVYAQRAVRAVRCGDRQLLKIGSDDDDHILCFTLFIFTIIIIKLAFRKEIQYKCWKSLRDTVQYRFLFVSADRNMSDL